MCIKIWAPRPSVCKGNGKFEILIAKIFSLRQKANQILSATLGKIKSKGGGHEFWYTYLLMAAAMNFGTPICWYIQIN